MRINFIFYINGAIAQLGERLHGMQEVRGSIPLGSTKTLEQFSARSTNYRGVYLV